MTATLASFDGGAFGQYAEESEGGRFIRQYLKVVFSGNYPTGGDAIDLTNAGGTPNFPNTVPSAAAYGVADIDVIVRGTAASLAGVGGGYAIIAPNSNAPLKFADLANLKVKAFKNTAGSVAEYPAGAYGADVLADVLILEVVYAR